MKELQGYPQSTPPDVIARATAHELDFWSIQPDVTHVFPRPFKDAGPGEVELLIWLTEPPAGWQPENRPYRSNPLRPADLDVWGGGEAPYDFLSRLAPVVEHMVCIEDFDYHPDFECAGWWAMKVWLKR